MSRNPIDISTRVSPELSELIETLIDQLDTGDDLTLGGVRDFISHGFPDDVEEEEEMHHFDFDESVIDELDELIEQFGESAAAMDFISAFGSEAMSRVIEEVSGDENRDNPPTLEDIRAALLDGIAGRMVGEGALEDDEVDGLMGEIEDMIDRFGPDALAEDFVRYE